MRLSVPVFGQRDPQWSGKPLGSSKTTTLGSHGCVVTSMAMICRYYGKDTDPERLNDAILSVKGFIDTNLFDWKAIVKIYADIQNTSIRNYPTSATPVSAIDTELNAGRPVIAWVDLNPNQPGADHFVVITGKEGNDYWINDPWYGDQILCSRRYGDPVRFIFGHRSFSGPVPTNNTEAAPDDTVILARADAFIAVCERLRLPPNKDVVLAEINKFLDYERVIKDLESQNQQLRENLASLEQQIADTKRIYEEKIATMQTENMALASQVDAKSQELEKTRGELASTIKSLSDQLQELKQATSGQPISILDTIVKIIVNIFQRFQRR